MLRGNPALAAMATATAVELTVVGPTILKEPNTENMSNVESIAGGGAGDDDGLADDRGEGCNCGGVGFTDAGGIWFGRGGGLDRGVVPATGSGGGEPRGGGGGDEGGGGGGLGEGGGRGAEGGADGCSGAIATAGALIWNDRN